jgi:tetratricopeptide (TPR) repeat protein
MRADVVQLVRQKRYEEALSLLYEALSLAPGEREFVASIAQIKEFLSASYARRLGGLDRVAGPVPLSAAASPDAMLVARFINGISTFEDISHACPLGRLRTLQVLVALYAKAGVLPPTPSGGPPPSSSAGELPSVAAPPEAPPSRVWPSAHPSREVGLSEPPSREILASSRSPSSPSWSSDRPPSSLSWPSDRPPSSPSWPSDPPSRSSWASDPPSSRSSWAPDPPRSPWAPDPPRSPWAPDPPSRSPWASDPPSRPSWSPDPPLYGAHPSGPPGGEPERSRWGLSAPPPGPEDEAFRAALARGTAAFVQRRYDDAVEAFRECVRLRPEDPSVAMMLTRSLRGLGA